MPRRQYSILDHVFDVLKIMPFWTGPNGALPVELLLLAILDDELLLDDDDDDNDVDDVDNDDDEQHCVP